MQNPPCPYCGEELETIDALASIGIDTLWSDCCGFISAEVAEGLQNSGSQV